VLLAGDAAHHQTYQPMTGYCKASAGAGTSIPVDGSIVAGWMISAQPGNYYGTIAKPGQTDIVIDAKSDGGVVPG
jgi:hypothetical protein